MKLIIDIPEQWRDDMVWENFDKVDELCQAILDGDIIPDNVPTVDVLEKIRAEIEDYVCNHETNTDKAQGMLNALQILDKYR